MKSLNFLTSLTSTMADGALNVQIDNQIRARGNKYFAKNAGHIPCFCNEPRVNTLGSTSKLFITKIDENIADGCVTDKGGGLNRESRSWQFEKGHLDS
jgi:hypothetical protein